MHRIEAVYKAGFAIGGLSLSVFFLGHIGLLTRSFLIIALVLASVLFALLIKTGSSSAGKADSSSVPFSLPEKLLLASIIGLVLAAVPLALMPPSVRDELIQHLAVPKLYISRGRIFQIPFMGFSYLPQNIDILYAIPMAFGNDAVPRLMHLFFAVLTGLLVYFYLFPCHGRFYALLGMLLYLSTPLVFNLSRMAYIDHGSAFFSTLSFVAALKWRENDSGRWLVYAAISMGFALGAKYNNAISLLLIGAFIFFTAEKRNRRLTEGLRAAAVYFLIALAVFSPWLFRNYLWKGSPFYPIYESAAAASARGEGFHVTGEMAPIAKRYLLYRENTIEILLLPFRIFLEGKDNSIEKFDGVLNPLFLAFIPLAFIRRGDDNRIYLLLYPLIFLFMTAFTVDLVTRYLLPALPAVIMLVTIGVKNLSGGRRYAKTASVTLVMLLFLFNIIYILGLYRQSRPFQFLTGQETREEYLAKVLPDYSSIRFANSNLPVDAKVMLIFAGDRGYYWDRDYYFGDRTGVFLKDFVNNSPDNGGLKKKFTGLGITHLFINDHLLEKFANDNFKEDKIELLAAFFKNNLTRMYGSNGFSIYRIE